MANIYMDPISDDNLLTGDELTSALTITGKVYSGNVDEPVIVTLGGNTESSALLDDGTWSVTFSSDNISALYDYSSYKVTARQLTYEVVSYITLRSSETIDSLTKCSMTVVDKNSVPMSDADMKIPYGRISNEEVTNFGTIYDMMMCKIECSLEEQCKCNRITGEKYADAYIAAQGLVISNANQVFTAIAAGKTKLINDSLLVEGVSYDTEKKKHEVSVAEMGKYIAQNTELSGREKNRQEKYNYEIKNLEAIGGACKIREIGENIKLISEQIKGFYRDSAYKIYRTDGELISMLATSGVITACNASECKGPYSLVMKNMDQMAEYMLSKNPSTEALARGNRSPNIG